MPDDSGGISDEVSAELNVEGGPDPGAKGSVEVYVQVYEPKAGVWAYRTVTRHGALLEASDRHATRGKANTAARAAAKASEVNAQFETYPGASGGPPLPVLEGEPE